MTRDELKDRFYNLVAEGLQVDRKTITESSKFADDLWADSLDEVELIMAVEEEFDIEIDDRQAESTKTVSEALDRLASALITAGK